MPSDIEKIMKRIGDLPPLPMAVSKLLSVVEDENSSARDITKILQTEQALTAKILRLVNSSFYGFSRSITTLSRAVVILGYRSIRNLALSFSAYEALSKLKGPVNWAEYWEHCLCCAASAQVIAQRAGHKTPEEAFIACLLHDIGFAVMSAALPDKYATLHEKRLFGNIDAEREVIGLSHPEIGIRILENWRLPENLCQVARFHHSEHKVLFVNDNNNLLAIAALADLVSVIKGAYYCDIAPISDYGSLSKIIGLKENDYQPFFQEATQKINDAREFLNIADNKPISTSEKEQTGKIIAFITTDSSRRAWVQALLNDFGYSISGEDIFHDKERMENLELVMLDGGSLPTEAMLRLGDAIVKRGHAVCAVSGKAGGVDTSGHDMQTIPFIFSRKDIRKAMQQNRK